LVRAVLLFLVVVSFSFAQPVKVLDIQFAVAVQEGEPVGISEKFPPDIGKVYCWSKVEAEKVPVKIYHVWYYGDKEVAKVELEVKSKLYSVWSAVSINPQWKGVWKVEVQDGGGNRLAEKSFEITENWR